MNMFGEEAVVAGSTSALQRIATNTAWAAVMGPARAEDASTGVASRQERRARPSRPEKLPGTFTITAVQPERMWASETGFRSAICVARTATRRLADGKIRDGKWDETHGTFGPAVQHGARRT